MKYNNNCLLSRLSNILKNDVDSVCLCFPHYSALSVVRTDMKYDVD